MTMKKRILACLLCILVLLPCITSFADAAAGSVQNNEPQDSPTLTIAKNNLQFVENVQILYAVKLEGVDETTVSKEDFKLLCWDTPQSSYLLGNEKLALTTSGAMEIDGEKYYVFEYKALSAKQMADDIYARAVLIRNGNTYYSELSKYSVLQYAYNKLGYTAEGTESEELKALLMDMLRYGASAQKYFNYKTDRLASDTFYQITLTNGHFTNDNMNTALVHAKTGAEITAAEVNTEGAPFAFWMSDAGKIVAKERTVTVKPTENAFYTAVYSNEKIPAIFSEEALDVNQIPCKVNFDPGDRYLQNYQYFAMQASVEMTAGGRLWSCWIGGGDNSDAYLIATYSDDKGETWKDIQFVIDPHNDDLPLVRNVHIGCFWQDPLGRLWLFYQQSLGMFDGEGANFAIICENPDDENPVWSEPQYISVGASLKKPIVTQNGEWLLPVSIWERNHPISEPLQNQHTELDAIRGARVYASTDLGATWEYRGGVDFSDRRFNEHSIAELDDGRIMMYSRCKTAIKKSYSSDGGRTWSAEEIAFPHVDGLAMIRTLPSGNLLLVKHGQSMTEATESRSHLTAFVSRDNGETWEGGLLLDGANYISYPDIAIGADGKIYVQYDQARNRSALILFARFTEEEVLAGAISKEGSALRQTIKDTNGIKGHPVVMAAGTPFGGSGSSTDPYTISNADQWQYLIAQVASGNTFEGMYLSLTSDIDFGGITLQPVGFILQSNHYSHPFRGFFNGNDHTLSNFTIDAHDLYCRGLFGYMDQGSVQKITVDNALIRGRTNVGAIVGSITGVAGNRSKVQHCTVGENVTVIGYQRVGGVIGNAENYVTVQDCVNNATVKAPFASADADLNVGGVVGYINNRIHMDHCVNNGTVIARHADKAYVGGITSNGKNCTILYCINNGTVIADDCVGEICIGGIAAWQSDNRFEDCANHGTVLARGLAGINAGGLVGYYGKDDSTANSILRSYSTGEVTVEHYGQTSEIMVGGLVGRASAKAGNTDSSIKDSVSLTVPTVINATRKTYVGSFIGKYVADSMTFEGNLAAEGTAVGRSSAVSDVSHLCTVDKTAAEAALEALKQAIEAQ